MESTEYFQKAIAAMLDNEAAKDPIFADTLKKEGKNIEECCDYIIDEVEKSGKCGFADEEILGMAKHYWDEDDVEVSEHSKCRVVVNREVELTDEDKAAIKREAMEREIEARRKEMEFERKKKAEAKQSKQKPEPAPQMSLFDL